MSKNIINRYDTFHDSYAFYGLYIPCFNYDEVENDAFYDCLKADEDHSIYISDSWTGAILHTSDRIHSLADCNKLCQVLYELDASDYDSMKNNEKLAAMRRDTANNLKQIRDEQHLDVSDKYIDYVIGQSVDGYLMIFDDLASAEPYI